MLVTATSESVLPIFALLNSASGHNSHRFLETYFRFKSFLLEFHVRKCLFDFAHDMVAYYLYCRENNIQPFIDLSEKHGTSMEYKNDFTISKEGVTATKKG